MRYLFIIMATLGSYTVAQLPLKIFINDEIVKWEQADPEPNLENKEIVKILFEGGWLEINLADYGIWDYAHVVKVKYLKTAEDTYTFHTTVRHRDEGWEHYANVWRVIPADDNSAVSSTVSNTVSSTVSNGERVLLHPHDNEQPFTRSQNNVTANGTVRIETADNVHGLGGSVIYLDLNSEVLKVNEQLKVRFEIE